MDVAVGLVCTSGRGHDRAVPGAHPDAYVVGTSGRVAWLEEGEEHALRTGGHGALLAVVTADEPGALGQVAASAVARVIAKLYVDKCPRDPRRVLQNWLSDAHTRLFWKAQAREASVPGVSVAVAWLLDGQLHWVEIGSTCVWLQEADGRLRTLAKPWPLAAGQRMITGSHNLGDDTALHFEQGVNTGTVPITGCRGVLLASDGLWQAVEAHSAEQLLTAVPEAQAAAVSFMERAVARGTRDDVTVIVARPGKKAAQRVVPRIHTEELAREVPAQASAPTRDSTSWERSSDRVERPPGDLVVRYDAPVPRPRRRRTRQAPTTVP